MTARPGSLGVDMVASRGDFRLAVALAVNAGEVVAVVGPNGAGKTSLLRAIAGLDPIVDGSITIDERVVAAPADGVWMPAADRRVGMVFQDYLLFPHLTIRDNLGFGLRARGLATDAVEGWIERLELGALADRRPAQLSGGEAQRVALGRALIADPAVLLLDEPLAALDIGTRHEVRRWLVRHLQELPIPTVLVTHDPIEAALIGDRLVVLEGGAVTHSGSLTDITSRPLTPWAARLAGVNLYSGEGTGRRVVLESTELTVAEDVSGPTVATIHPNAVVLHRHESPGSPRNRWPGVVTALEPAGARIRVAVDGVMPIIAEITPAAAKSLQLADASEVWISVKATEIDTYPR